MMGLFDGVEKLIDEHGSAKILGERLLLAKDQHAAQEKRISELVRQLEESETEKTTLRLELKRCQSEYQKANKQLRDLQPNDAGLPEQAIQILKAFFDAGNDLCPEDIARHLRLQKSFVDHCLDLLIDRDFLCQTTAAFGGGSGFYGILPKGRAFIVKKFG